MLHSQDIESIDPQFYKSLLEIISNSIDDMYLCLTFSADRDEFGIRKTVRGVLGVPSPSTLRMRLHRVGGVVVAQDELVPGGSDIEVTDANKHEYVRLIARHRLTSSIRSQIDNFLEGLFELVPRDALSIFDENELELIVSGMPTIDGESRDGLACVAPPRASPAAARAVPQSMT